MSDPDVDGFWPEEEWLREHDKRTGLTEIIYAWPTTPREDPDDQAGN